MGTDVEAQAINHSSIQQVRKIFPNGTIVLIAPIRDHRDELHDEEKRIVVKAVEQRQLEFSTGRLLAAKALRALGKSSQPVLRGSGNEPVWPSGIVGSISHNRTTCVVAVAKLSECGGIGVDLEVGDADVSDIASLVLRPDEIDENVATAVTKYENLARRTFSAKESVYKAVYPRLQRFVEFAEVRLEFRTDRQSFKATAPENPELDKLLTSGKGGYVFIEDSIVSNFVLADH